MILAQTPQADSLELLKYWVRANFLLSTEIIQGMMAVSVFGFYRISLLLQTLESFSFTAMNQVKFQHFTKFTPEETVAFAKLFASKRTFQCEVLPCNTMACEELDQTHLFSA